MEVAKETCATRPAWLAQYFLLCSNAARYITGQLVVRRRLFGGMNAHIGVVGAGIVGVAVARHLLLTRPGCQVTVLEKENDVACHQTGHNSGVVHAGLYYQPGSLKSILCRRGGALLKEFCLTEGVPYEECGKLVVALNDDETVRLRAIHERAIANGVPGVRLLQRPEMREIEPHVEGVLALHSPHTAIVDYGAVARALAAQIRAHGGQILFGFEAKAIRQTDEVIVESRNGAEHRFSRLVICAGLQSDRVADMAGDGRNPSIIPFRGEYLRLKPERSHLVRGMIYPVPDPRFPFLGVHFTRNVSGAVDVGPNAVLALAREGYTWGDISVRDIMDIVSWPGFWTVMRKYWKTAASEVAGSLVTQRFLNLARAYVPEVTNDDVVPGGAGVRAQAVDRQGNLVDDFVVNRRGMILAVRNAPSPAATASMAIAEHICKQTD
jgi:(S)-2-hydroxyglutarate dehydrogenase